MTGARGRDTTGTRDSMVQRIDTQETGRAQAPRGRLAAQAGSRVRFSGSGLGSRPAGDPTPPSRPRRARSARAAARTSRGRWARGRTPGSASGATRRTPTARFRCPTRSSVPTTTRCATAATPRRSPAGATAVRRATSPRRTAGEPGHDLARSRSAGAPRAGRRGQVRQLPRSARSNRRRRGDPRYCCSRARSRAASPATTARRPGATCAARCRRRSATRPPTTAAGTSGRSRDRPRTSA